jgi:hypothetical protein
MRVTRIAMLALLAGIVACTSFGQPQPYGRPPGTLGQVSGGWRQPDDSYDHDQGPDVDVGFFYSSLSPYGEWVRHPQYGWVWFPRHVQAGWRPYSLGRWVESDYGWMWVSNEPFGWATYHYGRWTWDPYVGWLWVPGTDWGPAWVAWQHGNGYVGWAPLPPQVGFEHGVGIRLGGFNLSFGIAPRDYSFVEERRFLHTNVHGYVLPPARNITIINHTTNVTNYTVVNNRVINRGVPVERIEQVYGNKAPRFRVAVAASPGSASVQRDVINVYRPTASKLETVRVAPRNNAGLTQAVPAPNPPEVEPRNVRPPVVAPIHREAGPVPIPVAPRVKPAPQGNSERQFAREQKDLQARLDKEQKALDQIHRQELAQAQVKANAQEVTQQHAAELQAQQERRERAGQQLQTRQQIERQAAQVTIAPVRRAPGSPAEPAKDKDMKKDDKKDDKKSP